MLGPASLELRRNFNSLGPQQMRHLSKRLKECLVELNEHEDMKALAFEYPGYRLDHLYDQDYVHEHHNGTCTDCRDREYCKAAVDASCTQLKCSSDKLLPRERIIEPEQFAEDMQKTSDSARKLDLDDEFNTKILPKIFLGAVASGNEVMKNGKMRDDVAAKQHVIAFEMEGAGVWSSFPTVVIKAGCDYGDSHKNKKFQKYASMTAAACAKAFLSQLQMGIPRNVECGADDGPRQTQQVQQAQQAPFNNNGHGGTVDHFNGTFTGSDIGMGETCILKALRRIGVVETKHISCIGSPGAHHCAALLGRGTSWRIAPTFLVS